MSTSIKTAALRFLKRRPHSVFELREKLRVKGFIDGDIQEALQVLEAGHLLDDRAFTNSWINDRLARPFGFRRIIAELKAKGVDKKIIDGAVSEAKKNYHEEEMALPLAQRRFQRIPGVDKEKQKKRIADFLIRRGFLEDTVIQVINGL